MAKLLLSFSVFQISGGLWQTLFFFISRYNGSLPNGDRGRRKSRFALYKRPKANGVKPSTVHVISTPQASKVRDSGANPVFLMILGGEQLMYYC